MCVGEKFKNFFLKQAVKIWYNNFSKVALEIQIFDENDNWQCMLYIDKDGSTMSKNYFWEHTYFKEITTRC